MKSKKPAEQRIYETEYKKIMKTRNDYEISPEQKDQMLALLDRIYKKFRAAKIIKRRAKTRIV